MARTNRVTVILDAIDELTPALKEATGKFVGLGAVTTGIGATISAALGMSANAAMTFESAMADVNKVLGVEEVQAYKVDDALLKLSRTIPNTAVDLANIAASGGQLGIAAGDITAFTEQTAKMGIAFDMAAGQAGESTAKLMNVFSLSVDGAGTVADAINHLSNNSASTAADIVNTMTRIGGVARSFGLSSTESAALSSSIIALGNAPEVAATAISSMLPKLQTATSQMPKFQAALDDIGISAAGMEQAVQQDAAGAIVLLTQQLNRLEPTMRASAINRLFGDGGDARVMATLANDATGLTKALEMVADESQYAGSMQAEFEARVGTSANGIAQLRNAFQEIQIHVGRALLPSMNSLVGTFVPLVQGIASFAAEHPGVTRMAAAIAAVAGGVLTFVGSATLAVAAITPLLPALTTVVGFVAGISFAPILLGLGAIAAIGVVIYKNWATIKEFFTGFAEGFKTGVEPIITEMMPLIVWSGEQIQQTLQMISSWFGQGEAAAGARNIGEAFGLMAASVIGSVVHLPGHLTQIFTSIGAIAGSWITNIKMMFVDVGLNIRMIFTSIGAIAGSWVTSIKMLFVNLGLDIRMTWLETKAAVVSAIEGVISTVTAMGDSILATIQNVGSRMFQAGADLIGNLTKGIQSGVGGASAAIGGFMSRIPVAGGLFGGGVPIAGVAGNAAGGSLGSLLGAAIAETRRMPSGSRLVVANSSEAILNQGQQRAVAASMGGRGGGTFAPQINLYQQPGENMDSLLDRLMARMDEQYQAYEAGFLT
ncbi:phage tail tape measure protein [Oculatella sp. LEGE 06141]|uniref:phage tail tape measure protein n=1 Tax=Oculatella sp. LEGE 06141 TaxID=1828648 RepID=UPI001881B95A|nr:phage tail tape measure protein [Oculatella sp. LEGE 06141]MBE9178670.1 phage tail tape measure protein [Oculatella sp. LEGE 06141]